ncbi:hypothetical protein [Streptomyces sp. RLB1-9]|uniref:hypothetical protein n=1 Tax=Streptomyces sp. RLB1-9 TaxID=2594454 RepID=UPI0013D9859D|nr:hypothetical protein [Streptomyces sp. RLB1-9]
MAMQLQALLHQNQTLQNLPSSTANALRQARQNVLNPTALLGGQVPTPVAPNAQWLQQTAAQFLSQVVLNQPQNRRSGSGGPTPPGPTPPTPAPTPATPLPPYPYPYSPYGHPHMPYTYTGPMPGYGGPLVAPSHPGSSGGHASGIGSWTKSMLPRVGAAIGGPWGAVAGAAIGAATDIPAEVRSQRDKNAYYQSIEGGSNFDGFGERASEELYRWSTFGVLSSDEARKAFKGVTKLGYNSKVEGGVGRQDALNFIYHGKTRRGETVDESLQQLQVNSKNALGSLNDLSNALNAVSDSAGKAGVNAQSARAEFTQLMDQAIKQGYGSSSADVASLEQQTKNSYGRSYQDVDVSGRLTLNHAYMAASMSGMSVSQYLTSGVTSKGAADAKLDQATASAVLKPGVEGWIKDQISKAGGAGNLNEDVVQQIAEQMIRQFYPNDSPAMAQVIAAISGQSTLANDPVKAAFWLVQQYNDKGTAETTHKMTAKEKAAQKTASKENAVSTGVGNNMRQTQDDRGPNAGKSILGDLDKEKSGDFLGFGGHNSDAYNAYQKWHDKNGGQEDPVVYHLLDKIKGDDKTKVAVTTKSGKRVVSLADAIKNHRNELASGKAVVVEGDQAGKTVSEILGKDKVDPLRDFSKEAKGTDKSGETYAKWEKEHTTKDKKGRDKLEVTLSAEARRLLTVLDSTGVAGSSATATPPLSPYASNPSYGGE